MLGDLMMICAAVSWAATTLVIKTSTLNNAPFEKTSLYQLVVSVVVLTVATLAFGESIVRVPSGLAIASLAYQSLWVASISFVVWFALVQRYSASRLSAFTFLTPLFGVAAGHLVLDEPLTPAFAVAVALVAAGLVLVNSAMTAHPQVPIPKFASTCGTSSCELRNHRDTSKSMISGPF